MRLSERNLPDSKQSRASAVRSRKMTKKICRPSLTSSVLSDPVAGWEPISANSHHHATSKEHKKQPRFCVVLTRAGAVPVLNLREKRASNRPSVLKPFFRRFFGGGQPSGPHQSRKSQAFVKSPPPFSPFSSIVTPYKSFWDAHNPPCCDSPFLSRVMGKKYFAASADCGIDLLGNENEFLFHNKGRTA